MIWYRHWLELRSNAVTLAVAAVVVGPAFFRNELLSPRPFRASVPFEQPLQSLTGSLDSLQLTALTRHMEFVWLAVLFASLTLAGDGLRTFTNQFGRTGLVTTTAQYTLSLPLSRRYVVMTRIAAGYVLGTIVLLIAVIANAAALMAFDRAVPLVPMLFATGFGTMVVLFWHCVLMSLLAIAGAGWGMTLTIIAMFVTSPIPMWGMSAAAAGTLGWPLFLLSAVVLTLTVYGAVAIATGDEV